MSHRWKKKGTAVYHCMGRAVAGEHLLHEAGKEVFRRMLWQVAAFSGVEVLAYCLMSNHFHVLVRVPERPVESPHSRAEVLRRYRILYTVSNSPGYPDADAMQKILEGPNEALAEEWMAKLTARMEDVSEFMRTLKHRYTVYYNRKHGRFGTFWAERFKSVLVEDSPRALRTVAAYLDLNPVRAGLVQDPADYRWCSYAEAMAGRSEARSALTHVTGSENWESALAAYRIVLFGKGRTARKADQGSIPWEKVEAVLAAGGRVEPSELLRCRVKYFSQGAIIGSVAFVRAMGLEWATETDDDATLAILRAQCKRLGTVPLDEEEELASWHRLKRQPIEPVE